METTTCKNCGPKPVTEFNKHWRKGYQNQCRRCRAKYNKEHYKNNREKYKTNATERRERCGRSDNLRGLALADYLAMLVLQGGKCAICERQPRNKRRFCIDHDHKTGEVRGLLCDGCNTAIGRLGDTPEALAKAYWYLASRSGTKLLSKSG